MAKSDTAAYRVAAHNRRARHNYEIEDTLEAGMVLTGSEVKSLREGRATIAESYAKAENGQIWLINAHIPEYKQAGQFNHEPTRPRKLLLKHIVGQLFLNFLLVLWQHKKAEQLGQHLLQVRLQHMTR